MKLVYVLLFVLFLAGCKTTPEVITEYRPIYPPKSLTEECYPDRPKSATIGETIEIQNRAIHQCNDQLRNIRSWRELETKQQEDPSK